MGMFDQVKEAFKARSEAKRIQAEIQKISVSHSNGGITVTAKGDMTVSSISFEPQAYDEVKAGKPARFETMLLTVVNMALKKARDEVQKRTMEMMKAGGMGGLFGG